MDKLQLYTKEREADTEKCQALFAQFDADNSGRLERSAHSKQSPRSAQSPTSCSLPSPFSHPLCSGAFPCAPIDVCVA